MKELDNLVSITLATTKSQDILTYLDLDFDSEFNKTKIEGSIINYLEKIISNNDILKKKIVILNNKTYIKNVDNFDLKDYYKIKYTKHEKFDKYIEKINDDFSNESNWFSFWCIDIKNKKGRLYFKIDHAYADGYKIIEILCNINDTKKLQKERPNRVYYIFIGTLLLLISYVKFFFKCIFSYFNTEKEENEKTCFIKMPALKLNEVKTYCKKHKIKINDFLYTLMIHGHSLYLNDFKNFTSVSPINVSKDKYSNNMCPLFLTINNSKDIKKLLRSVHDTFNNCKYSLFIPFLFSIIRIGPKFLNISLLSSGYNLIMEKNIDFLYSNIIGPSKKELDAEFKKMSLGGMFNINNIHYLTTSLGITYNIISYENNINVIVSYKKNKITNKIKYKKCFLEAFNKLIH